MNLNGNRQAVIEVLKGTKALFERGHWIPGNYVADQNYRGTYKVSHCMIGGLTYTERGEHDSRFEEGHAPLTEAAMYAMLEDREVQAHVRKMGLANGVNDLSPHVNGKQVPWGEYPRMVETYNDAQPRNAEGKRNVVSLIDRTIKRLEKEKV